KRALGLSRKVRRQWLLILANPRNSSHVIAWAISAGRQDIDRQRQALTHLSLEARDLQAEALIAQELIFWPFRHDRVRFVPNAKIARAKFALLDDGLIAKNRRGLNTI